MKVLFDAYTSPDIQLYTSIGEKLRDLKINVEYVIPSNDDCVNLMKKKKISFKVIGWRSPGGFISKIFSNIIRAIKMIKFLYENKPDVVISRAVSTPIAAKLLRRKVAMFIDNDAARLALLFTLPLANRIYMPKAIEIWGDIPLSIKKKTFFYDGIEEQIYLTGTLREDLYDVLGLEKNKDIIVVRPFGIITEYESSKEDVIEEILKKLVNDKKILRRYHIIALPRTKDQRERYKKIFGDKIVIPDQPVDGESLLLQSRIFIGAGGTMTREAWVLGNVVFSFYRGKRLSVERWLSRQKNYFYNKIDRNKILKTFIKAKPNINTHLKEEILKDFIKFFCY